MSGLRGRQPTKLRQAFAAWEATAGKQYYEHTTGEPNYLRTPKTMDIEDGPHRQVFPENRNFISQPVLCDRLKEEVWRVVSKGKSSIRQVSVDFKIDIRRVAAVVRLKEIEKQWKAEV